jgi:hypothetical protein
VRTNLKSGAVLGTPGTEREIGVLAVLARWLSDDELEVPANLVREKTHQEGDHYRSLVVETAACLAKVAEESTENGFVLTALPSALVALIRQSAARRS